MTSDESSALVESFVRSWLTQTDAGRKALEHLGVGVEAGIECIFELLNTGFLKLEMDGAAFTGHEPCLPPSPPSAPIQRPKRP
jgi:hypothetical protein